ncbi:MAG: hypothetical protein FH752_18770 [Marinobacter adhaerens]|jgi:hypothetical protein|uniref:Uncharacterized protein n=1 Tax=Marinobacter adhaerens TaxID=1033846 RepID=A0A844I6Q9_9GAMM|nr:MULTISPECIES: hypothetical protein [unclassified Marinobacter]AZT82117.1 hypothetical protein EHN06_00315 [Marinobacter sp. NP-4(2019)]MTJ00654.1 hypothetical protein [Marinobacter adhaerens]|tara:strand:- start:6019 stop:6276 length:258 start_codon:yes stop_codon:yes gene_type:complete
MSASKEWTEWHLTPTGWVRGSEKVDYQGVTTVEPPADRVLTCEYQEYLSSSFSSMDKGASVLWESEDKEKVAQLLKQFGECPQRL